MEFISELKKAAPEGDTLVTIGVFDGVHRGHQHLIKRLVASAKERGYSSGVITFHPNPVTVVRPGTKVAYLTDIEERIELIKALSVDFVAPVTFTPELSQLTAREFVSLLMEHLHLRGLVVGDDFALGRGREGTIQVLTGLGQDMGFTVDVVAQHDIEGQRVTSSAIRAALAEGDIATVSAFLGHPYTIKGVVVPGAERGRVLGFPTANLSVWEEKGIPGDGIYATKIHVNSSFCNSATYVGTRLRVTCTAMRSSWNGWNGFEGICASIPTKRCASRWSGTLSR
ncbi:MAG: ribF [Dehalococcoidia bacterium]|nr:ribF [Dehalococcoidia bacterium]